MTSIKKNQPLPIVVLSQGSFWPNQKISLSLSGLKVGGVSVSRTPSICSVNSNGNVAAVKSGKCVIEVTNPTDSDHLASVRTVTIDVLAPSITVKSSTTVKGARVLSIKAGPAFAAKTVEVWTVGKGKIKSTLIGSTKLNGKGESSITSLRAKGADLVLKYNGKVIGALSNR